MLSVGIFTSRISNCYTDTTFGNFDRRNYALAIDLFTDVEDTVSIKRDLKVVSWRQDDGV